MDKATVVNHFGGIRPTALALGITTQAVYAWPPKVPYSVACKLQVLTKGRLKVNPEAYKVAK